jgi:nitroreductase
MNVIEAIGGRRSVREYKSDQLDRATIERLIDAAVHAPSALNQQPWTFTVVLDQALLNRISDIAKSHMLIAKAGTSPAGLLGQDYSDPNFHIFHHAPALIVIGASADGPWMIESCALAAENLMLAAYAEGLGTCWIGFAQRYLNTPEGKQMLGLPPRSVPIAPIILGHPKCSAAPVARRAPTIRWID